MDSSARKNAPACQLISCKEFGRRKSHVRPPCENTHCVSAMDVCTAAALIAGLSPTPGRIATSPRPPTHAISTSSVRPESTALRLLLIRPWLTERSVNRLLLYTSRKEKKRGQHTLYMLRVNRNEPCAIVHSPPTIRHTANMGRGRSLYSRSQDQFQTSATLVSHIEVPNAKIFSTPRLFPSRAGISA